MLSVPAMAAEVFWSAELLVALGSTFGVLLGRRSGDGHPRVGRRGDRVHDGGRHVVRRLHRRACSWGWWPSAWPSRCRTRSVPSAGSTPRGCTTGPRGRTAAGCCRRSPRTAASGRRESLVGWWDVSLMLIFGGIPWNCYFQRVLSCRTPARAQWHSILVRPADDRAHGPAAPVRRGGVRLCVAPRPRRAAAARSRPTRCPLLLKHLDAAAGRAPRHGRDHRGGHVELQFVDPVGRLDVQLEHVQAAAVAVALRRRG